MMSNNLFTKLTKQSVRSNWWLMIVNFIVLFFAGPVFHWLQIESFNRRYDHMPERVITPFEMSNFAHEMGSPHGLLFFFGLAFVFGVMSAVVMYRYLHSKKQVNFYHSMPIKREKLFLSNYVTGMLVFVLPLVVVSVMLIGLWGFFGFLPYISLGAFAKALAEVVLFYWVTYSLTVLAGMFCGTVLSHIVMSVLIQFIVTLPLFMVLTLKIAFFGTFNGIGAEAVIFKSSPIFILVEMFSRHYEIYPQLLLSEIVGLIAVSIIASVLALVVYKKRSSEMASNPLVFKKSEPILEYYLVILASVFGGILFGGLGGMVFLVFGTIAGGLLTHMVCQVAINKDFKAMFKNMKGYVASLIVVGAVMGVCYYDVAGFDRYLPSKDEVSAVHINMEQIDGIHKYWWVNDGEFIPTFDDPETIEKILALLEDVVREQRYRDNSLLNQGVYYGSRENTMDLYVKYTLANGKEKTRAYDGVSIIGLEEKLADIHGSQGYKEVIATLPSKNVMGFGIQVAHASDFTNYGEAYYDMSKVDTRYVTNPIDIEHHKQTAEKNAKLYAQLAEAMNKDLMKRTFADLQQVPYYMINVRMETENNSSRYGWNDNYMVLPSDKNTLAVLEAMDMRDASSVERIVEMISEINVYKNDSDVDPLILEKDGFVSDSVSMETSAVPTYVKTITDKEEIKEILGQSIGQDRKQESSPVLKLNKQYDFVAITGGSLTADERTKWFEGGVNSPVNASHLYLIEGADFLLN